MRTRPSTPRIGRRRKFRVKKSTRRKLMGKRSSPAQLRAARARARVKRRRRR